jgi:hypothetical protein
VLRLAITGLFRDEIALVSSSAPIGRAAASSPSTALCR